MSVNMTLRLLTICYLTACQIALCVFVLHAHYTRPQVRITSWEDFTQDVGGFWLDMLAHTFAWPYFANRALAELRAPTDRGSR